MQIPLYQVDAFTSTMFGGNPAAVCPLDSWLSDETLLAIAAENNLSETAFLVPDVMGEPGVYRLRWFTPRFEVRLCGHATLASAFVVFNNLSPDAKSAQFQTLSGRLGVRREKEYLVMDFPSLVPRECVQPPSALLEGLRPFAAKKILETGRDASERNYFAVYETEAEVRDLRPDLSLFEKLHPAGVCVTAPGTESDFVSRYFVPSFGIPEDPVTGSTHCSLTPYWTAELGKTVLTAKQLSSRGGEMICELVGDHVLLKGQAVLYMKGEISI